MKERRGLRRLRGLLSVNTRGVGFFARPEVEEDIRIEPENLLVALHGDEVEVEVSKTRLGIRGKVLRVLERRRTTFVGVTQIIGGQMVVKPDNYRIHVCFQLVEAEAKKAGVGNKVLIELFRWTNASQKPIARLLRVIGKAGQNDTEILSIALSEGFAADFPPAVLDEASAIKNRLKTITESEERRRRDFRNTTVFTIDPADAKDFDDALSLREIQNPISNANLPEHRQTPMYEIGVHIADVSFFVKEHTALDREAATRATSLYLVDRTIPMLPPVLSSDLSSLNEGEDKMTFSAVFKVTKIGKGEPQFKITNRWFGKTIIRSKKRFTYEEAQDILKKKSGQFYKELSVLDLIAKSLRREKFKNGAIDFEQDEVRFELDSAGRPVRVFRKERLDTRKLVEELMLLANKEVAEFMYRKEKETGAKHPFLYRIHDLPDREKIAELAIFLKALGHELPVVKSKGISSKDLAALFQKIEGRAEEALVKTAALRTMAKAVYSTKNIGHFGLAFPFYTHFTSPIRRYPDLCVHRLLDQYLLGRKINAETLRKIETAAVHSSRREIEAQEAERNSIKLKQVEYMANRIGQEFKGTITGVNDWGIYVEEKDTRAEGMVKLRNMKDDYYELDEKNYQLIGQNTKKVYRLGDQVDISLANIDLERRQIEFILS